MAPKCFLTSYRAVLPSGNKLAKMAKVSLNIQCPYKVIWLITCVCVCVVCVCVRACIYGLAICCWWAKRQGWPGSSLRTPLHPQVGWQATLMTLDGTQTLVASRMTELDSRGASERDLVLLLGNSGKLDLEKDRDDDREGWWPDRRRAMRTSSLLLVICLTSWWKLRSL